MQQMSCQVKPQQHDCRQVFFCVNPPTHLVAEAAVPALTRLHLFSEEPVIKGAVGIRMRHGSGAAVCAVAASGSTAQCLGSWGHELISAWGFRAKLPGCMDTNGKWQVLEISANMDRRAWE